MFKKLIHSRAIRARTSLILAIVLVPPFIFFFHMFSGRPEERRGVAGTIFGHAVSWDTFNQHHRLIRQEWRRRLGEIPAAWEPQLLQQTWDRLLLIAEAERRKLRVSDEELAAFIHNRPEFQDAGWFVAERYYRWLAALGRSSQQFEASLREQLLVERLVDQVNAEVAVTDEEVRAAYVKARERLRVVLVVVDPSQWREVMEATLTEELLREAFAQRAEVLRIPEQIVIEVAGRSHEAPADEPPPGEEELQEFYQRRQDLWTTPEGAVRPFEEVREELRARLVEEQGRRRLNALAIDLESDRQAQRPFEELIATYDLRRRTAGPMPVDATQLPADVHPSVLEAVRELPEGRVSGVIETGEGVYLARVIQRLPSRMPTFEEVREPIRTQVAQERARQYAREAAQRWRAQLAELLSGGATFEEASRQIGLTPDQPEPFTRTDPVEPIGFVPTVNEAAFATPLGTLSEVLETPAGFVLLLPTERLQPDLSGFDAESPRLREQLLDETRQAHLTAWLQDLRVRAKVQSFADSLSPKSEVRSR